MVWTTSTVVMYPLVQVWTVFRETNFIGPVTGSSHHSNFQVRFRIEDIFPLKLRLPQSERLELTIV